MFCDGRSEIRRVPSTHLRLVLIILLLVCLTSRATTFAGAEHAHGFDAHDDFAASIQDFGEAGDRPRSGLERERRASRMVTRMRSESPGRSGIPAQLVDAG